jgi:hypothetical protein
MELSKYISHSRNREYMSGIERDKLRVKATSEVFTKTEDVQTCLDEFEDEVWLDINKKFIDPSCGDGQFLSEVVIRKMERSGCTLEQALSTTYGVELMEDNVKLCKERLAGPNPTPEILDILDKNIVCADALTYHYRFDGTPPTMSDSEFVSQQFYEFT